MKNNTFAHLHVHTEYSQLDGYGSVEQYVSHAKNLGFKHLAISDHGNIDGAIKFQKECEKQEISSIIGCELYVVPRMDIKTKGETRGHICLFVKNEKGWLELCRLLTIAHLEGFYRRPRVDFEALLNAKLNNFVITTACSLSFVHLDGGEDFLYNLWDQFNNIYFEVMPHNVELQKDHHKKIFELKKKLNIPFVATNDCHYIEKNHWKAQEVLLAVQTKSKWDDKDRWKFSFKGLHLRTADEMIERFKKQNQLSTIEINHAMRNAFNIAKECSNFKIEQRKVSLPVPPQFENVNDGMNGLDYKLDELCKTNIKTWNKEYKERYKEEFSLITKKEFTKYFLIVYDLIEYCKKENIMMGPGRGSVGGSLIAFLLGITNVDPIKYNLLFSRFISKNRIDIPDIDVDFEDFKRDQVRDYLAKTYGENNICGISTFLRMKSKMVIRDVGRVFKVPYSIVDQFAKAIWHATGNEKILPEAFENLREGKILKSKYPEIVRLAIELEGQIRGAGQHPAGIIVSERNLKESGQGFLLTKKKNIVVNWDMDDCSHAGLMKLDVLGLKELSILSDCRKKLNIKYEEIPLDDKNVYKNLSQGNTAGVFQLSGYASTEIVKRVKPKCFEDIVIAMALPRPGPADSGMADEYIERRNGKKWKRKNEIYENVTKDTYGLLIYQEQVMQVINKVAGLSESTADEIRKVIGKKRDVSEFEAYRKRFIYGCKKKNTLSKKEAEKFWEGLLSWANYGFNKSHAVGYAILAYWTAWTKYNHPTDFISSGLTFGSETKKEDVIKEAIEMGIQIVPPKLGISNSTRWIAKDEKLFAPFIEIKGIGEVQAEKCTIVKKQRGFFDYKADKNMIEEIKGKKLKGILEEVGAYDSDLIPTGIDHLFPYASIGNQIPIEKIKARKRMFKGYKKESPLKCKKCELRIECGQPVLPSPGRWNVAIIGEAPGVSEDRAEKGFVGKAGRLLWEELYLYDLKRTYFHITNVNKCWPSQTKNPKPKHIDKCFGFLKEELSTINCKLALAFGNVSVYAFTGDKGGINRKSGSTEWIPELQLWICWCTHPSAVLRSAENKKHFEEGIENFAEKFKMIRR